MIVTAWNNGKHHKSGAGYGLKLSVADRDKHFRREWKSVFILLEGQDKPIKVNIAKPSFWSPACRELINVEIGRWLIKNGLAPWPKGKPPKLVLTPMSEPCYFQLSKKSV